MSTDTMRAIIRAIDDRGTEFGRWVPAPGFDPAAGAYVDASEPRPLEIEIEGFANALRSEVQHQEEAFRKFQAKHAAPPTTGNEDLI